MLLRIFLLALSLFSFSSQAHQLSTAFMAAEFEEKTIQGSLNLDWVDLDTVLQLDTNQDGSLIWQEVVQAQPQIKDYIEQNIYFIADGTRCSISLNDNLQTTEKLDKGYLHAEFSSECAYQSAPVLHYTILFDQISDHKLIIEYQGQTFVVNELRQTHEINLSETAWTDTFVEFVIEGVWHIWIGLDHILFLLVLLLPCMLYKNRKQLWVFQNSPAQVMKDVLLLVSTFTLAHSVTLVLSTLNILQINIQFVEFMIAVSILVCAIDNIFTLFKRIHIVVFLFGLLHGFGFASVLGDLLTEQTDLIVPLLAFNIGVEIGQIAIVLGLIPLLVVFSKTNWYRQFGMQTFSGMAGLMGLIWAIQRLSA